METPPFFCSTFSSQVGESLAGTAAPAEVFFLLEYNGAWGNKALAESGLTQPVKAHLDALQQATPRSKTLLIKSRAGLLERGVRFFVAVARELDPVLYTFHLESYEELPRLALPPLGETPDEGPPRQESPLYLVCTNGRRDACCARFGLPVYEELSRLAGESTWQCTHLGGHRFAANLLILPDGLLYGRVGPGEAAGLIESHRRGEIPLRFYRGRTAYSEPAQAAEYGLRLATNRPGLGEFRLLDCVETDPGAWMARFEDRADGRVHALRLVAERTEAAVFKSCRDESPAAMVNYRLVEHSTNP